MKITKHISFYFLIDRIVYINNIIDETNKYEYTTDIFIHTNNIDLQEGVFNNYTNGCIKIIYHDLSNIHPFYLTWKCRELLQQQRNEYDIFMYIEDDILVPYKAIQYWLEYNQILLEMNYNLGFVRIEVEDGIEYITDLYGEIFDTFIDLNEKKYCVNNIPPIARNCPTWFNTRLKSVYKLISVIFIFTWFKFSIAGAISQKFSLEKNKTSITKNNMIIFLKENKSLYFFNHII